MYRAYCTVGLGIELSFFGIRTDAIRMKDLELTL